MEAITTKRKTGRKGGSVKILAGSKSNGLNILQDKFTEYYTDLSNITTFANGLNSYAQAYGFELKTAEEKKTCSVNASKLLSNTNIIEAISNRLKDLSLNNPLVDSQLSFLIQQMGDLKVKMSAISEYNKLTNRIKPNQNNFNILSVTQLEDSLKSILSGPIRHETAK